MKTWYDDDKEIGIFFDNYPCVGNRYPTLNMSEAAKEAVIKYPFINKRAIQVALLDYKKRKRHEFTIPKGYCWDGASIPRVFWRLIGSKTDPKFLIPSLIHDQLCEHHEYVDNDRYFADKVFERLLYVSGVPAFNRWIMFHSVETYQQCFGKWKTN